METSFRCRWICFLPLGLLVSGGWAQIPWNDPGRPLHPWVFDVDPARREVWAGVDHPYYRPRIPFEAPRSPEQQLEENLLRADRSRDRREWTRARQIYGGVESEASRLWGPGSRLAVRARERLETLQNEAGSPPEGTPASLERTLETVRKKLARARKYSDR